MPDVCQNILEVKDLQVSYGGLQALRGVSLSLKRREIIGVVGESGSGKSTLLRTIARLLPSQADVDGGRIIFEGLDVLKLTERDMRELRGAQVSYLFQNGEQSLDPLFPIGRQFDEVMKAHGASPDRTIQMRALERMGLNDPEHVLQSLPSELSGGMAQRVALAFALVGVPSLLLADEPTSSLDVDAQAKVIDLLHSLNQENGLAILAVSHDIDLISSFASRILVMHEGAVVEEGSTVEVIDHPRHPYTKELLASVPRMPEGKCFSCCS